MSGDRVTLADVLMGHGEGNGWQLDETDHLVYDCECGTISPPLALVEGCLDAAAVNAAARWHADHVAQVIRDHLTALAGDAGVRESVGRAECQLGADEPWPTNESLGGGPTGTRDDECRDACIDQGVDAVAAFLGRVG